MAAHFRSKHALAEARHAHDFDAPGLQANHHAMRGTVHSDHDKQHASAPLDHEGPQPGGSPPFVPPGSGAGPAHDTSVGHGGHGPFGSAAGAPSEDGGNALTNLLSHLPQGGEDAPIYIVPVDHLAINNNAFVSNTQVENTNIVFNADHGSSVDVEGDVNAFSFQGSQINVDSFQMSGPGHSLAEDLGWGDAAWGEAGGYDAVLVGHLGGGGCGHGSPIIIMPIEHLEINNNTFIQNTQIENTNIVFNADHGGDIDIDGDINAIATQNAAISAGAGHHELA